MSDNAPKKNFFQKHIALPNDHGSWVFLLSPLLIGIFAGGTYPTATTYLIIGVLSAFLLRQPTVIAIKAYAGRRSSQDIPIAQGWIIIYGLIAAFTLIMLIQAGFFYILALALPGLLVFFWHLALVSRRAERYQITVDILAAGSLALSAPAAYWIALGHADPVGWYLWALVWAQSAASIAHAFMRLEQRKLTQPPTPPEKRTIAARALSYTGFNFIVVLVLSLTGLLPPLLHLPYLLQFLETLIGAEFPAMGIKPTQIGIRQLIVSTLFTILFILTW